jgi:acyl-CoA thioesterase II
VSSDALLESAVLESLEGLLGALRIEPMAEDRFRARCEPARFDRVFGGQVLAQAVLAAAATVTGKEPHSVHAAFVEVGMPDEDVELVVDRVRDGRSMSTRRVMVLQQERPLLAAIVSFHDNPLGPEVASPIPGGPRPEQLPLLQHWARELPDERREHGRTWLEQPPPVEIRVGEAPTFLGGPSADGTRGHWMRLPRDVGDDPSLHAALLTYASDYLLLDMAFRSHPELSGPGAFTGVSLDHAVWMHRPTRFDRWHLHSQETVAILGHRGLVKGAIHDVDGRLVATVMQEVLVRPTRQR